MRAVMVMFDSLNRHLLPAYGCNWTHAPNFSRLAERAVTFDKSYVCSMPCMPARRELHTGRANFLHRSWGPLEPFDDSMPQILHENGIHSHLATDHYHYFEDGGATYHNRYSTWEFFRGQEGDPWIGQVKPPDIPPSVCPRTDRLGRQDWVNRQYLREESHHYQTQTFDAGLRFIDRNRADDNWFLQIECFDPHEPFFASDRFRDRYPKDPSALHFDWPAYREVTESPQAVEHCRREYAALLSQCDFSLGRVLDAFDQHNLWDDTMLIVWTDHGFHLGERNMWAKVWMGWYEQTAHTPFFVWDPRSRKRNERRQALVQPAIDLAPTLLDFFNLHPTRNMLGLPLGDTIAHDKPVREAAIYGHFGADVNVTDGRYTYTRRQTHDHAPLHQYTLFPTTMRGYLSDDKLRAATTVPPFSFTNEMPVLRLNPAPSASPIPRRDVRHDLYDLASDPDQQRPLAEPDIEQRMISHLRRLMTQADAPTEQFTRLGL